jgi:hypothetical protein
MSPGEEVPSLSSAVLLSRGLTKEGVFVYATVETEVRDVMFDTTMVKSRNAAGGCILPCMPCLYAAALRALTMP